MVIILSCTATSDDTNREQMGIFVPDIIPMLPTQLIRVFFNDLHLQSGNELTPTQVKFEPTVQWITDSGTLYTLAMIDTSFTDPYNWQLGEMLHWLVVNIPGAMGREDQKYDLEVKRGNVVAEYVGACPPQDDGVHRFLILAYKQQDRLKVYNSFYISARTRTDRLNFKISEFVQKYNLSGPIAGNFFLARYDDFVQEINKQFDEEAMKEI